MSVPEKGMNTYAKELFQFFISNKFAKIIIVVIMVYGVLIDVGKK